jgi:hypothetical protein
MEQVKKRIILSVLNLLAFLATITVNGLANALPLGGRTTGEISDQFPNLFVPAGFTFSIWGVIYILLALFVFYQLVVAFKRQEDTAMASIDRITWLFLAASAGNCGWLFTWHFGLVGLSLIALVGLSAALIAIYLRVDIRQREMVGRTKLFVAIPFSVYLGWVTVATIANVTALLVHLEWNRFGLSEEFWTIAVLVVGIIIALLTLFSRQDLYYCLVIEWAYFGILMKRIRVDTVPRTGILVTVSVCMGVLLIALIVQGSRRRVY